MTQEIEHRITLKPGKTMPKSRPRFRRSLPHRKLMEEGARGGELSHRMTRRSKATSFQNLLDIEKPGKEPRVGYDARAVNDVSTPEEYQEESRPTQDRV
jgi:hypothetical protein